MPITNNNFSGLIGINMNGDNSYDIRGNSFKNSTIWSSLLYSTGISNDNTQSGNNIASQRYGIVAIEDNTMYQFSENCFDVNGFNDIIVVGSLSHQGTENLANANCFSDDIVPDIAAYTNGAPFAYWEPNLNLNFDQCVYSTTSTPDGYVIQPNAFSGPSSECNIIGGAANGNGNNFSQCLVNNNPTDISNEIANIHSLISNINQTQFSSLLARESELAALNRCLIKLYNQLAYYYSNVSAVSEAVNVYNSHPLFEMQIKGFFILVHEKQFKLARNYLNGLNSKSIEEEEFKASSSIYLNAIEQGSSYILSSSDENLIYQAALKSSSIAGYSRSIWMYFKGEDIRMDIILPDGSSKPRSQSKSVENINLTNVFPNPANIELTIEVKSMSSATFGFKFFDMNGRVVKKATNLNENYTLDTSGLKSGLYICNIIDDKGVFIGNHKVYIQ